MPPFDINSLMGMQVPNEFKRGEYVTVTGVDSVKNTYTGKTKSGQTYSSAIGGAIGVEGTSGIKASAKVSNTSGVISAKTLTNDSQVSNEMSMPVGEEFKTQTAASAIANQTKQSAQQYKDYKSGQLMLAGAQFGLDVFNANSAYSAAKGQAALNIIQSRNQAADSLFRGRQAQADAQSEGVQAGQSALLAMAAQGQDLQGAGVEKIQGSLEAMGIMNGMREEVNAMREALGFKLEEINYDYQLVQAGQARNNAIIGSALNLAASAYVNKSGVF